MNRLSHSAINKFLDCPHAYQNRYINKIVSKYKSGALYFGSAMDEALNYMLENFGNYDLDSVYNVFLKHWKSQKNNLDKFINLKTEEDITYSASDFDSDLLEKSDYKEIFEFINVNKMDTDIFENYKRIKTTKSEIGWNNLQTIDRKFYNLLNWLSLKRKAWYMIQAYERDIIPEIKRVIAVQKYIKLENQENDKIIGYVDAVVELKTGKVVVLDNKTSSIQYGQGAVKTSPQLSIYMIILNNWAADKDHEWKDYIDLAMYAVLKKQMSKDIKKECTKCGAKLDSKSRVKTCDKINNGKRCHGEIKRIVTASCETEIVTDDIPEDTQDMILENINLVNTAIKSNVFPRNFNACEKPWGKCEYYDKCWFNNEDNLITKPSKKDKK